MYRGARSVGKVRNTIRANQYNAQLSAADLENERLSEQASLAEYFFEIRGQDDCKESSTPQSTPTRKLWIRNGSL